MNLLIQPMEEFSRTKESLPDRFDYNYKKYKSPNDNFIISRDRYGKILSFFSDDIWDLTPYALNDYTTIRINFASNIKKRINIEQYKRMIFLMMALGNQLATSNSYSVGSIRVCASTIKKIIYIAEERKVTLFQFLANSKFFIDYMNNRTNKTDIVHLGIIYKFLYTVDNRVTGVNLHFSKEVEKNLSIKYQEMFSKTKKQTVIIPTRILSNSIAQRWRQIKEIEPCIDRLCKFIENIINNKYFAAASTNKYKKDFQLNAEGLFWEDVVKKYKLITIFNTYKVKNKHDIQTFVKGLQGTCNHLIHMYTGMRKGEVLSLQENCIKIKDDKYVKLIGITTKFAGYKKEEEWATSKEMIKVINILEKLSRAISIKMKLRKDQKFLFMSTSNITSKPIKEPKLVIRSFENFSLPLDNTKLTITEKDILELEEVEYGRDFRSEEKFKIGNIWSFSTHQYRRSLAVYSINSGLISLGSLQAQFKHLFREMTMYYQKGSSNAKDILKLNKNHFVHYRKNTSYEIDSLVYIKKVLLDSENTYGIEGKVIKKYVEDFYNNDYTLIFEDRDLTLKKFKNGEIVWRNTMLGGCTKLEPCDDKVARSLTECISCKSAIHKLEDIKKAILYQKEFLSTFEKNSIEYKTERVSLDKLENYYNSIKDKNDKRIL